MNKLILTLEKSYITSLKSFLLIPSAISLIVLTLSLTSSYVTTSGNTGIFLALDLYLALHCSLTALI